ncbi:hypothetical protein Dda_0010 [Drechslerella dactyloides]|uniref:GST C-terminal domain-containing protein n=1 Tax=Drechslerella dactyloides TaxID=74499 RepID=A0AAD6NNX0_DREDA|nr:hypothetical protein Dda_0010 [Drechslerella dactyloides]
MQHNFWPHPSRPGIPTVYSLTSSSAIRTLWALEELVANGKLEQYNVKTYKRQMGSAPPELKEGFRLGMSPALSVAPATAPDEPPTTLVESRLINQFLADHYSDGIWNPTTKEDQARDVYFQEFANSTLQTRAGMVLTMDIIPQPVPWPFKILAMAIFRPIANVLKKGLVGPLELMEDSLSEENPWFSGPAMGLADFCMVFSVDICVARGYLDAKKYPKITQWHKTVLDLPTYKSAISKMGSYNLNSFDI